MEAELDLPLLLTQSYGRVVSSEALFVPARVAGVGAHGVVQLGLWTPLKRMVAIKACQVDMEMLPRLRAEARALIQCCHPFIVSLHGILQHERTVYFVLKACVGGDLYYRFHVGLARDGVTAAPERFKHVMFYLQEVVCALEYLHSKGVAHGDLKTENILIDAEGHVQLADFGSVTSFTKSKKVFGVRGSTMHFPPEMLEYSQISLASDMWTLGCVAFEMLTGSRPHPYVMWSGHSTMVDALNAHNVDARAADLVRQLLHTDPDMRPSIHDVKKHALFANVDWGAVKAKQVPVPWTPRGMNVDDEFLDMTAEGLPDAAEKPLFYIVKPA